MDKAIWLAQLLHRHGNMTRNEILNAWCEEDSRGKPMGQTTFYDNRHVLEARYGIRIVHHNGSYSIEMPTDFHDPVIAHIIERKADNPADETKTLVETWLDVITEGQQSGRQIHMCYASPGKTAYETILSVYAVRHIKSNCYAVGLSSHHKSIRTFAIDRIQWLRLLPLRYKMPKDFCANTYFQHSFGAYGGTAITPQHIILEASARAADYFRGRPLHNTQREIAPTNNNRFRFELNLSPTEDFIGQLMAFAPEVVVVEPKYLRKKLIVRFSKCLDAYNLENGATPLPT